MRATKTLGYVQERMDENEFFGILLGSAVKAFVTTAVILGALAGVSQYGGDTAKGIGDLVSPGSWIAIFATVLVFSFIWRSEEKAATDTAVYYAILGALALGYSIVAGLCGEAVALSLFVVGYLFTSAFLIGEVGFTAFYTWRALVAWVKSGTSHPEVETVAEVPEIKGAA